jgi:hypothetical protein
LKRLTYYLGFKNLMWLFAKMWNKSTLQTCFHCYFNKGIFSIIYINGALICKYFTHPYHFNNLGLSFTNSNHICIHFDKSKIHYSPTVLIFKIIIPLTS